MSVLFWVYWGIGLLVSTFFGSWVVRKHRERGLLVLGVLLALYVVASNIFVPRLVNVELFGLSFVLVTGSITWPFIAQLTDMINEIYGRKSSVWAAVMAYVANFIFVTITFMSMQTVPLWEAPQEEWFRLFFAQAWRPFIASTCSYTLSNLADIAVFSSIKAKYFKREQAKTVGKQVYRDWWSILKFSTYRSALSDGVNMVVDNIVFYGIAFYGTMPNAALLGLIGSSMLAKVILSQVDVPFYWLFRVMTPDVKRDL